MYADPTVSGGGRTVNIPDMDPTYWGAFGNRTDIDWTIRHQLVNVEKVTPIITTINKGQLINGQGRYWVYVGPKVLKPSIANSVAHLADQYTWNVRIDIVVQDSNKNVWYIPAIPGGLKGHTYDNGIYQTGYAYPVGGDYSPDNMDPSAVEFMGATRFNGQSIQDEYGFKGAYEAVRFVVYDQ